MLAYHHDYAKKLKFKVPLHPKNLMQMIHPHYGYITNYKGKEFSFEELHEMYLN
jgi:hypothetical protein